VTVSGPGRQRLRGRDVVVTGATGFVGSHLTRSLIHLGAHVHVLIRDQSSLERLATVTSSIHSWRLDLSNTVLLEETIRTIQPAVVFHLASVAGGRFGIGPDGLDGIARSYSVNLNGTLALLWAIYRAAPRARLIRTGTIEEYGAGPVPYKEDQRESPLSPYSASHVAAAHLTETLSRQLDVEATTVRPALIYGPSQALEFFIPSLIDACLGGRDFDMTTGEQIRDVVYVDDVVEALTEAAVSSDAAGQIINVGSGRGHRVLDIAELIVRLSGSGTRLRVGTVPARRVSVDRQILDSRRAGRLIGWSASTSLEAGLRRTIDWYRGR